MVGAGCPNLCVELLGGPGDQNVYMACGGVFWAPKALFGVLGLGPGGHRLYLTFGVVLVIMTMEGFLVS